MGDNEEVKNNEEYLYDKLLEYYSSDMKISVGEKIHLDIFSKNKSESNIIVTTFINIINCTLKVTKAYFESWSVTFFTDNSNVL